MTDHPPHHDEAAHTADHDDHDDHGAGGHGHGADPHAGVVRGTPPTPAWVLTAAVISLVTALATVVLAIELNDAIPSDAPKHERTTEQGEHADEPAGEAPAEH
ncbi:MAG TPA: hypothetical protein VNA14_01370 [Mycobacteriales bacterium]|nr:hypothetical protein [Mycobacteriales bacterium]